MRRVIFAVFCCVAVACRPQTPITVPDTSSGHGGENGGKPEQHKQLERGVDVPAVRMRLLPFDEAAHELIIRSLPLTVALPASYQLFKNEPIWGTWMWTTRESHAHLQEHGSALLTEGVFQIKITTGVGYLRDSNQFICGPECDEEKLRRQVESVAGDATRFDKNMVNGVPILTIEGDALAMGDAPRRKLYMAYIATLIDTNVVMFSYTPPADRPREGARVWAEFKQALLSRRCATAECQPASNFGAKPTTAGRPAPQAARRCRRIHVMLVCPQTPPAPPNFSMQPTAGRSLARG